MDLEAVQSSLDYRICDCGAAGSELRSLEDARSNSERTYLLRLLAEFEGGLTEIGGSLNPPLTFSPRSGLAVKLDRISQQVKLDPSLKTQVDTNVRDLRNDLMHGRSKIPRVPYNQVFGLMKAFLRWCP